MLTRCIKCGHWMAILFGSIKDARCSKCGGKLEVQVRDYR